MRGMWVEFHFLFLAMLTFACLFDDTGVALMSVVASAMHELAHFIALWRFDCKPNKLSFELGGVTVIKSGYRLCRGRELLVLGVGSAVNLLAFSCCFGVAPYFAGVHLLVGCFNLLPFSVLDGGKMLAIVLDVWLSPWQSARVLFIIQIVFLVIISIICIVLFRAGQGNWLLLITASYLFYLVFWSD